MRSPSLRSSSPRPRRLTRALAPLALTTLLGCGTRLTPTVAYVSGQAVEIVEAGAGSAVVLFESGLGNGWEPWDEVASAVAGQARVFAYSRPGYGESAPSPAPRDAARIVADLRTLLAARGVTPPYLLVGHSFGGAYMELFAKAHSAEVAGLVLVDTRHRDFTLACQGAGLEGCTIPDAQVDSLPPVQRAEFRAFAGTSEQIRAAGAFGAYPVRVLTATAHGFAPPVEALWRSMQGALAREAQDGEQALFDGAGHYLQNERARGVGQVIRQLLGSTQR